jgi:hypothetical protein
VKLLRATQEKRVWRLGISSYKFSSWCGSSVHPFCDWVWCIAGHRCEGWEVPSSRIEGGSLSSRVETECQILPNLKVRLQWCWHSHDIHDRSCFNQCLDDLTILFHHIPPVIQVLFCIGELLEERESGKTDEASKLSKRTKLFSCVVSNLGHRHSYCNTLSLYIY